MMTRRKRRFRPGQVSESCLEVRIVLNGAQAAALYSAPLVSQNPALAQRVPPVLIGANSRGIQYRDSATTRVSDAIDRSFDSFTSDYLEAQAAYFAAPTQATRNAFTAVTTQRVNLLSQELIQNLSRLPGMLNRPRGAESTPLQLFLFRKINNPGRFSQSLLSTLVSPNTVPVATEGVPISPSAATLSTLTATNAIEAARVATVNASKFVISGAFTK